MRTLRFHAGFSVRRLGVLVEVSYRIFISGGGGGRREMLIQLAVYTGLSSEVLGMIP